MNALLQVPLLRCRSTRKRPVLVITDRATNAWQQGWLDKNPYWKHICLPSGIALDEPQDWGRAIDAHIQPAVMLVASGVACITLAQWTAHSLKTASVHPAFLVDVAVAEVTSTRHATLQQSRFPFPCLVVSLKDAASCCATRSQQWAYLRQVRWVRQSQPAVVADMTEVPWPDGYQLLQGLSSFE